MLSRLLLAATAPLAQLDWDTWDGTLDTRQNIGSVLGSAPALCVNSLGTSAMLLTGNSSNLNNRRLTISGRSISSSLATMTAYGGTQNVRTVPSTPYTPAKQFAAFTQASSQRPVIAIVTSNTSSFSASTFLDSDVSVTGEPVPVLLGGSNYAVFMRIGASAPYSLKCYHVTANLSNNTITVNSSITLSNRYLGLSNAVIDGYGGALLLGATGGNIFIVEQFNVSGTTLSSARTHTLSGYNANVSLTRSTAITRVVGPYSTTSGGPFSMYRKNISATTSSLTSSALASLGFGFTGTYSAVSSPINSKYFVCALNSSNELWGRLVSEGSGPSSAPVMIDTGVYSLSIGVEMLDEYRALVTYSIGGTGYAKVCSPLN